MALFNLASVSDALQETEQESSGVSFVALARKWENEQDGEKTWSCESLNYCAQNGAALHHA
jgi:replicative superfamily II helicase